MSTGCEPLIMLQLETLVSSLPKTKPTILMFGMCAYCLYAASRKKLLLKDPDYFAAAFISALAYHAEYVTDAQIRSIRKVPIWFIHSKDDPVTLPEETAVPIYNRLLEAGARNVHFSYYDHVTDITNQYGGEGFHYSGHWSWIYSHANVARQDFDGGPVLVNGRPVTVMEWLAAQEN